MKKEKKSKKNHKSQPKVIKILYGIEQKENKFIRLSEEKQLEIRVFDGIYDVLIWDNSDGYDILLEDVEALEVVNYDGNIFVKFFENGKCGAFDVETEICIPSDYEDVRYFDNNGAVVVKNGKSRYCHAFYGEFPSAKICEIYVWLMLYEDELKLDFTLIETFFRIELNRKVETSSINDVQTLLMDEYSQSEKGLLEKFFEEVRSGKTSNRKERYGYEAFILDNLKKKGRKVKPKLVSALFARFGVQVEFNTINDVKSFISDKQNEKFFVENFDQIAYDECLYCYD